MTKINEIDVYLAVVEFALSNYSFMSLDKTSSYEEDLSTINKVNDILFNDTRIQPILDYRDVDEIKYFIETTTNRITAFSIEADEVDDYEKRIKHLFNNTVYTINEVYMKLDEEHTSATEAIEVLKNLQSTVIWNTRNMINEDTSYTTEINYSRDLLVSTTLDAINKLHKAESIYREAKTTILKSINKFKLDGLNKGYKLDKEGLMK